MSPEEVLTPALLGALGIVLVLIVLLVAVPEIRDEWELRRRRV